MDASIELTEHFFKYPPATVNHRTGKVVPQTNQNHSHQITIFGIFKINGYYICDPRPRKHRSTMRI